VIPFTGGASEPSETLFPGNAGGTVAVRRTLACTICRIIDPTQVPRPRQLRDASTVMRFRPAHQSMINRRFDDRASCPARKSLKQALACKPRIHSPAPGNSGHESEVVLHLRSITCCPARSRTRNATFGKHDLGQMRHHLAPTAMLQAPLFRFLWRSMLVLTGGSTLSIDFRLTYRSLRRFMVSMICDTHYKIQDRGYVLFAFEHAFNTSFA